MEKQVKVYVESDEGTLECNCDLFVGVLLSEVEGEYRYESYVLGDRSEAGAHAAHVALVRLEVHLLRALWTPTANVVEEGSDAVGEQEDTQMNPMMQELSSVFSDKVQ